jgi:hypothetical protein
MKTETTMISSFSYQRYTRTFEVNINTPEDWLVDEDKCELWLTLGALLPVALQNSLRYYSTTAEVVGNYLPGKGLTSLWITCQGVSNDEGLKVISKSVNRIMPFGCTYNSRIIEGGRLAVPA